jgi:hypothetical protein
MIRFVGYDLYIIVNGSSSTLNEGSYGGPCVIDAGHENQPILGYIWLNIDLISLNSDDVNFHNLVRQTTHAIAMHTNLYRHWDTGTGKYSGGGPYTMTMGTPSYVASVPHHSMHIFKLTSPAVVEAARTSFGCATLPGL